MTKPSPQMKKPRARKAHLPGPPLRPRAPPIMPGVAKAWNTRKHPTGTLVETATAPGGGTHIDDAPQQAGFSG